jgi:predicted ArsR family transcriptional regulator
LDRCLSQRVSAERHKLLGHAHRLVIVEALEEGPREIPELARLLGVHTTTVRGHLEKLLEAGFLEAEPGVPAGRGRPPKRYRLRHRLLGGDPAVHLFVSGLVALLRKAWGERASATAEEEGVRRGRDFGRRVRYPSSELAVRDVVDALTRLSFAPDSPTQRNGVVSIDVRNCPFGVDPNDPNGAVICAFHKGLIQGLAGATSGHEIGVGLLPFVAPGVCRVELSAEHPAAAKRRNSGRSGTSTRARL